MGGGMAPSGPPTQSTLVTSMFAFNLAVGVGALVLPYSLNEVGWLFGALLLVVVALLGFVSVTFVLEAIGNTAALLALRGSSSPGRRTALLPAAQTTSEFVEDEAPGIFHFRHLEMANMAEALFPRWGQTLFYLVICIYLYGDLAIYAAFVPQTLADFTGWSYNIFLAFFAACMVPFAFFNFEKTKYLQLVTLGTRNAALLSMIILTLIFVGQGKGSTDVKAFKPSGLAGAFGNIVYAFMVHHSIPSMVAPMKDKSKSPMAFSGSFSLVLSVYVMLSVSAIFGFANIENDDCGNKPGAPCNIQKMYTKNFSSYNQRWLGSFLMLFPVFTLTSNFPLISITLRNNLLALFDKMGWSGKPWQYYLCCVLSPCPPLVLAFIVHDVSQLVAFTGGYAGLCIMFVIPTLLVMASRSQVEDHLGSSVPTHDLRSPFRHRYWAWLILAWSVVCLVVITTSNIITWSS